MTEQPRDRHNGIAPRLVRDVRRHPSAVLLLFQLLALVAYPFFGEQTAGRAALGVVGMLIVVIALWAVRHTPATNWVAVLIGAPALVLTVLEWATDADPDVLLLSGIFHAPFYFYVSYSMIRYLFHDNRVTTDELFATGAAFTVVAWGFAYVFSAVQVIWPGSFGAGSADPHSWFELLFLSFTTLTSTGLSDVMPVLPHARSFVMIEQLAGVMYVGLVVARLVGLTLNRVSR